MLTKKKSNLDRLDSIVNHVSVLNHEVGLLQNDMKWVKRTLYYVAAIISVAIGKILFFPT